MASKSAEIWVVGLTDAVAEIVFHLTSGGVSGAWVGERVSGLRGRQSANRRGHLSTWAPTFFNVGADLSNVGRTDGEGSLQLLENPEHVRAPVWV